jgi:predicted GNAT family acetyltransferase
MQYDFENSTMYTAIKNDTLKGYILIYHALEFPNVILESEVESEAEIAERLMEHAPANHFVMHTSAHVLPKILGRFPNARHYVERWMLAKKGETGFFKSDLVRKLNAADGSKLAMLLSTRIDRPQGIDKKYPDLIRRIPMFGVFIDGELVSKAESFIQTPQIWMIGGVYTHPFHGNRGYAVLATQLTQKRP